MLLLFYKIACFTHNVENMKLKFYDMFSVEFTIKY